MNRILIVEDDNSINSMLCEALAPCGYECVSAYSGTEALLRMEQDAFSLVILDLMLPGMNGKEVLAQLRQKSTVPILILSALDELDSKVSLLTLGANDYMTKPFEIEELKARVLVQLRNADPLTKSSVVLRHRNLCLDEERKELRVDEKPLALTAQEFKLMELFLKNPGRVFSKNEIYEYAWDDYYMGEDKTINVHISNIRQKLKKASPEEYIETVWGLGFRLL